MTTLKYFPATHIPRSESKDVLSELLASLQVIGSAVGLFEYRSPWAVELPYEFPLCFVVTEGQLCVFEDNKPPKRMSVGDICMLPRGTTDTRYLLCDSENLPISWVTVEEMLSHPPLLLSELTDGSIRPQKVCWGGEGDKTVSLVSIVFSWSDSGFGPFIDALPECIYVSANDSESALLDLVNWFPFNNTVPAKPGQSAITTMTAQMFLAEVIRTYALVNGSDQIGWLKGFTDSKLSKVLTAMHNDPGRKWTLNSLASQGCMSKASFTAQFRQVMGESPFAYLRSWRLHLAREALAEDKKSITSLARELGYQSEAAFRTAFRQETGQSPSQYAKSLRLN